MLVRLMDLKAQLAAIRRVRVSAAVYYFACLHEQEAFSPLVERGLELPQASRAAREALALPLYAEMSRAQLDYVVDTLAGAVRKVKAP